MSRAYESDINDGQWELISKYFEQKRVHGRQIKHDRRTILNGILYVTKSGCQWRMIPHDFPPFGTVYDYYRRWCEDGTRERVLDALNTGDRVQRDRNKQPSYGIIDSQSVKTQYCSQERGIDGGKKIKGRKRHIVTDINGRLLHVKVHAANIHDTKAACSVLEHVKNKYKTIKGFSADAGYRGTASDYIREVLKLTVDISRKLTAAWTLIKRRVVERTFAWINNSRRLAKDFEIHNHSAENFVRIAIIKIMLDRFT